MDVNEELLAIFTAEADEILARMEQGLVQLESQPRNQEQLESVFRGAHTLKGNSAALGFEGAAEFSHEVEEVLDRLRSGEAQVTPPLVTLLLRAVDALRDLLADSAPGRSGLAESHRRLLEKLEEEARVNPRRRRSDGAGARSADRPATAPAGAVAGASRKTPAARTLRVDMHTLDRLLGLAGEIAINRDRLVGVLEGLGAPAGDALELHREADRLHDALREAVIRARMVPLGPTFRQHVRTVRDLAQSHGKDARLLVEGDDVAVDATVIDYLRDPLIHMVRNAFDHGLESPEARAAVGKPLTGTIELRARRDAGQIVVEVADDGAGLDRKAILRRARERGLLAPDQTPAGTEIDQLVFAAGLSTSREVTDLSGRGVGLDVVRRSVEAVHGSIEIESEQGRGTTIRLRLPLTLAIIDGFHLVAGGRGYVVPTNTVVECREAPSLAAAADSGLAARDGHALPYLRLGQLLGPADPRNKRQSLVVVRHGEAQAGLVVDQILGAMPTVVRPLGALFRGVPGFSGSTITRSGEVALILDVGSLLQQSQALTRAGAL